MSQILLTNDFGSAPFDRGRRTVWLHHDKDCVGASRTVSLSRFMDDPRAAVSGADLLVVCGLVTRLCTPSNRVKLGQFLTEPWWGPPRISVDRCLFVGEPWRMWWHWGCVGRPFANYFTSYRLESDWKRYIDTDAKNPCTIERIVEYGRGVVSHRGGFRFRDVAIHVEPMSAERHQLYADVKERVFNEEKTIAAIIRRLSEYATSCYPSRHVPRDLFAAESHEIRLTDLGVDVYLASRIRESVALTNAIAGAFAC